MCFKRIQSRKHKDNLQNGRKYLQITHMMRFVPNYMKKVLQLNNKKTNDPVSKCTKNSNRHFSKEVIQMVNKDMQRYSASLSIKEMQIKTKRSYFTPIRVAIIKNDR